MSREEPSHVAHRPSNETILDEQREGWNTGDRPRVEELLARYSFLSDDAETVLDLIYHEYVIRRELGETPHPEEYLERFPEWSDALARQFAVDDVLRSIPRAELNPEDEITTVEGVALNPPGVRPDIIDGYEILGELGRGGMGVVYRAFDRRLSRQVAIKTMGEASASSPAQLRRFRAEAEVIARLVHPHIIPIYAIGEYQGRPYFSLEYAEGGSLADRLAGSPLSSRDAAELTQTLARALHAAHCAGIVHRDLKPSNVLFHRHGTAKIADFGLAKLLGEDSSQTLSGEVLGTPSFMAPEQAEGHSREVGPAADIYALGAILYQTLTGRPPFLGASAMETLRLVVSTEVVPPRRQRPDVPRDLETITLKCLEKEPRRRYPDAEALADDLRRFLEHRPIAARPIGPAGRFWRWCQRNPPLAALTAILLLTFLLGTPAMSFLWLQARADRALAVRDRDRAERSRDRAIGAVNAMLHVEDDDMLAEELRPYRKSLIDAGMRESLALIRDLEGDPRAEHQRIEAEAALARVQVDAGDLVAGVETIRKAIAKAEALSARDPSNLRSRGLLAGILQRAASFVPDETERRTDGERSIELLRSIPARSQGVNPGDSRVITAMNRYNTAHFWSGKGQFNKAISDLLEARTAIEEAIDQGNRAPQTIALSGNIWLYLCRDYAYTSLDSAIAAGTQAESIFSSLVRDHPEVYQYTWQLFLAREELGLRLSAADRSDEAIAILERARQTIKGMAPRYGKLVSRMAFLQGALALLDLNLRNAYESDLSRFADRFREVIVEAHEITDKLRIVEEPDSNRQSIQAITSFDLINLQEEDGRHPSLEAILDSERAWTTALRQTPGDAFTLAYLVIVRRRIARELADHGRSDEAEVWSQRSLEPAMGRPEILYLAATDRAAKAGKTGTYPTKLDQHQLRERRRQFVVDATEMLRQAIANAYNESERIRSDPAFDPIRKEPDFVAIVADLGFPANPFSP